MATPGDATTTTSQVDATKSLDLSSRVRRKEVVVVGKEICDQAASALANQKRPRLEDFKANNYINVHSEAPTSAAVSYVTHVTHVLCCPACQFMSLQEEALAMHALSLHSIDRLTVFRCSLCQAVSTQKEIMMEHILIYHGLRKQTDVILSEPMLPCSAQSPPGRGSGPPTGSRKRKSNIPSAQTLEIKADSDCAAAKRSKHAAAESSIPDEVSSIPTDEESGCPAPLDLSVKIIAQRCEQPAVTGAAAPRDADENARQAHQPHQPHQRQHHQRQHQDQSAKPQRQNFTDSQNSLLQRWFTEHKDKPYPSSADTRHLSGLTGLNYSQVKKWFANRRMRTKTPQVLVSANEQSWVLRSEEHEGSADKQESPTGSQWSATESPARNSAQ